MAPDDNRRVLIPEEVAARGERFGDRVAVRVIGGGTITFGEWHERAGDVAGGLAAAGVEKGDRVGLLMTNEAAIEFGVAYVGIHRAGAVAVPVNPRYARREIDHIVADCQPNLVLEPADVAALERSGGDGPSQARSITARTEGAEDRAGSFHTS